MCASGCVSIFLFFKMTDKATILLGDMVEKKHAMFNANLGKSRSC